MINHMNSYFSAEKQESLIFMAVGLLAIGLGAWLWMNGHRLKSMAWPLVLIALMQIVVGASVYLRTDTQLSALSAQLTANPAALKVEETTRMQVVLANFSIYKAVEMVLLIVGVGMIAFLQRHDLAAGIGVGLVLQAAFTLTLDIFAEARGADYLSALRSIPA
ncbi:MAG: hypothetical protein QUV35_15925 [Hydrogenophaga sp.]|uniref:hypothetical protein n=1 Tax=Hydrogenophaga sp. TaxID=1904254 RepID=UPI0026384F1A|nr:hypothetical protein [Hydrogenophaga sp.]MDM7944112.1 hypothetical protein [Hydrogenophaga sp.]